MRRLVPLVLVASGAGCSLITDLSELSPAATSDAGDPSADATSSDGTPADGAPSDTSAEDTSLSDGATTDAAPDAPTRTFCEQLDYDWGYTYCRDFDDKEPIEFNWDKRAISTGASIARDSTKPKSAPGAFFARVPASSAPCADAYATTAITEAIAEPTVSWWVRLGEVAGSAPFAGTYMTVSLGGVGHKCELRINALPSGGELLEIAGAGQVHHPFNARWPKQQTWTKIELNVNRSARTVDVLMNGDSVFTMPQSLDADCSFGTDLVLQPGIVCQDATSTASEVLIDNLVVP